MSHSMMFRCPHCNQPAAARKVQELSPLVRVVFYQCPDPECGHTFEVHAETAYTLTPSAMPDPDIAPLLPVRGLSHLKRRAPGAAQECRL